MFSGSNAVHTQADGLHVLVLSAAMDTFAHVHPEVGVGITKMGRIWRRLRIRVRVRVRVRV